MKCGYVTVVLIFASAVVWGADAKNSNDELLAKEKYTKAIVAADKIYWEAVLAAKQAYAAELQKEMAKAMQAGDLDQANTVNESKKLIDEEIAAMNGGEPLRVEAHGPVVVASAGFNLKRGLNTGGKKPIGYELNEALPEDGDHETGWVGQWEGGRKSCIIDAAAAYEGDAGLRLEVKGKSELLFVRSFGKALRGNLRISQAIMCPAGNDGFGARPGTGPGENFGPNWRVDKGEFTVLDGSGDGSRDNWVKTGIKFEAKKWYVVNVNIDVPSQTWTLEVDGETFRPDKPLGFRSAIKEISYVNYLPSKTFYIDAIKVIDIRK